MHPAGQRSSWRGRYVGFSRSGEAPRGRTWRLEAINGKSGRPTYKQKVAGSSPAPPTLTGAALVRRAAAIGYGRGPNGFCASSGGFAASGVTVGVEPGEKPDFVIFVSGLGVGAMTRA